MNENQCIGERLEQERKRLGYTAIEIYNSLNVAQTTYKGYETGKRDIPAGLLAQLWDMGFDVLYIVAGVYTDTTTSTVSSSRSVIQHRLVRLHDNTNNHIVSDNLLVTMYHVEEALIQAGAEADKDYSYRDLLMSASMIYKNKELQEDDE